MGFSFSKLVKINYNILLDADKSAGGKIWNILSIAFRSFCAYTWNNAFNLLIFLYSKIKVWDLQAALDPRAPASTLCLRTLVVCIIN